MRATPERLSIKESIPNPMREILPAARPLDAATHASNKFHPMVTYSNCLPCFTKPECETMGPETARVMFSLYYRSVSSKIQLDVIVDSDWQSLLEAQSSLIGFGTLAFSPQENKGRSSVARKAALVHAQRTELRSILNYLPPK